MPDEEMIRRVDKAILEYIYAQTGTMICNLSVAGVGIAAMRVPTEKMIIAGCEGNPTMWNENTDEGFAADVANDVYVCMIDAILK